MSIVGGVVYHANSADEFWSLFTAETTRLQDRTIGAEDIREIVALKATLSQLQSFSNDVSSASILPSYDLRRTQEIILTLSKAIKEKQLVIKPKKKFQFTSRRKKEEGGGSKGKKEASTTKKEESTSNDKNTTNDTLYILEGQSGESVKMTKEQIGEYKGVVRSLLIKNCHKTDIFCRFVLGSVRIEECSECRIFLGPCKTSVYLDCNKQCTVFISSHQLRIHKCHDMNLYVAVNSHPIIEDCTGMGFAPYVVEYREFGSDLAAAGLHGAKCWDNVVDFRWHRSTQSPNWHIIRSENRNIYEIVDKETIWGSLEAKKNIAKAASSKQQAARAVNETSSTDKTASKDNNDDDDSDEEL